MGASLGGSIIASVPFARQMHSPCVTGGSASLGVWTPLWKHRAAPIPASLNLDVTYVLSRPYRTRTRIAPVRALAADT